MQYTPLLPAVATGTIEDRSIVEPVRRIVGSKVWLAEIMFRLLQAYMLSARPVCHVVLPSTHHASHVVVQASYFEAVVEEIDPKERTVVACFPKDVGFAEACFKARSDHSQAHAARGMPLRLITSRIGLRSCC